jgi:Flp pilus assembly protein TadD
MAVCCCAAWGQDGSAEAQAVLDRETALRAFFEGVGALPKIQPGKSANEMTQAMLAALDAAAASPASRPQAGGVTSVHQLEHKIPKDAREAFQRGTKLSKEGDREKAIEELKRAIDLDPRFSEAYNNLGVQYYLLNRPQEAQPLIQRAVELDPASFHGFANLAAVHISLGNFDAAKAFAKRSLALSPLNAHALRVMDKLRLVTAE